MEIHIGWKVDNVIKSLDLDIHENLLFKLADELVGSLKENRTPKTTEIIEKVVPAAEERYKAEVLDVLKYLRRFGLDSLKKT